MDEAKLDAIRALEKQFGVKTLLSWIPEMLRTKFVGEVSTTRPPATPKPQQEEEKKKNADALGDGARGLWASPKSSTTGPRHG